MLKRIIINLNKEINIHQSLFSGQTFLWNKLPFNEDCFASVINKQVIVIKQLSLNVIEVTFDNEQVTHQEISDFIKQYFTTEIPCNELFHDTFKSNYLELWELLKPYKSLTLLRQHPFETLISFMCAQGIGMRLIRQQIERLCQTYGEFFEIEIEGNIVRLASFPEAETLARLTADALRYCTNNNRERASNIIRVAQHVAEGRLNLSELSNPAIPLNEVQALLTEQRGIGLKIADCVALFGLGRFEAFPIDTHVHQFMAEWFKVPAASRSLTPATYRQLADEARAILGSRYAGYAAHLLFHCWRCEVKKMCWF